MNSNLFSYQNLSFCIYIGNTSSINEENLFNYCLQFGIIRTPSSFSREKFCDFHLIEFSNAEQTQRFLSQNNHQINRIRLDVRSYKYILNHQDVLNIDRKFYIGPIHRAKDEHSIVQFYRTIDPTLQYSSLRQDQQVYLLFELNNRQLVTMIFERQRVPNGHEYRSLALYKPTHPKQFRHRIISMKNRSNQINVEGLTRRITEAMLIGYFHKRVPVIACYVFPDGSKSAVVEFNDRKTVEKILETRTVCLEGITLSLSEATRDLASFFSLPNSGDDDTIDAKNNIKMSPSDHTPTPPPISFPSTRQYSSSFAIPSPPAGVTTESGWSSPPRGVVMESPAIDRPTSRVETNGYHSESNNRLTTMDVDVKPVQNDSSSNDMLQFVEQMKQEIEQTRNEYRSKFDQDRIQIQREIDLLITEEQQTLDKLNHYLNDRRGRADNRHHNTYYKRKYSPS